MDNKGKIIIGSSFFLAYLIFYSFLPLILTANSQGAHAQGMQQGQPMYGQQQQPLPQQQQPLPQQQQPLPQQQQPLPQQQQTQSAFVNTVPVGLSPFGIAYNSNNSGIYVANFYSNSISILNGSTNAVSATIPLGSGNLPAGVAFNANNSNIYVTNFYSTTASAPSLGAGTVSVVNSSTDTLNDTIVVDVSPLGIAFNPDNGNLYVTNFYSGSISVIDGSTNDVIDSIPTGAQGPIGIAFNPDNGDLYVTNFYSGSISVIDGSTNDVIDSINGLNYPYQISYNSVNGDMYVTNPAASSVSVIDSSTNGVVENIPVTPSPLGITSDPTNGNLYVTNYSTDPNTMSTVSIVDSANNLVTAVPTEGSGATGIVLNPDNGNLYVTNWFSQTVSVIAINELLEEELQQPQQQQPQQQQPQQQQPQQQQPQQQQPQQQQPSVPQQLSQNNTTQPPPIYTITLTGTDQNGNRITNAGATASTSIRLTFTADNVTSAAAARNSEIETGYGSFECSLDKSAFAPCTSPVLLDSLPIGNHEFLVRASQSSNGSSSESGGAIQSENSNINGKSAVSTTIANARFVWVVIPQG